ncbi:MAG: 50S ribosomal protein L29 [Desulfobacterales bacterium]|nr:50S ribosomal protein L29 [Desulfobacterales bacterium]
MKASEIRELGLEEKERKLVEKKEELFNLRFQHSSGQLENSSRIKQTKREIARIKTVIRESAKIKKNNNKTDKE